MNKTRVVYFISYEYYDAFDVNRKLKQDSFVTTDGLLYISPSDFSLMSEEIKKKQMRIVTRYINVNRLDRDTNII